MLVSKNFIQGIKYCVDNCFNEESLFDLIFQCTIVDKNIDVCEVNDLLYCECLNYCLLAIRNYDSGLKDVLIKNCYNTCKLILEEVKLF